VKKHGRSRPSDAFGTSVAYAVRHVRKQIELPCTIIVMERFEKKEEEGYALPRRTRRSEEEEAGLGIEEAALPPLRPVAQLCAIIMLSASLRSLAAPTKAGHAILHDMACLHFQRTQVSLQKVLWLTICPAVERETS
jgi:hypothetical protein